MSIKSRAYGPEEKFRPLANGCPLWGEPSQGRDGKEKGAREVERGVVLWRENGGIALVKFPKKDNQKNIFC